MTMLGLCALSSAYGGSEEPAADTDEVPEPEPAEEEEPAVFAVGVHLGAAIPLQALDVAFLPRVEAGFMPTSLNESLLIYVSGAWLWPGASASGSDPRVVGSAYDWSLRLDQVQLGAGVTVRVTPRDAPVHPELSLGPQLVWLRSTANGSGGETSAGAPGEFGETRETWVTWGVAGAVGIGVDVGAARILGRVEYTRTTVDGVLTGVSPMSALNPTLGVRLVF